MKHPHVREKLGLPDKSGEHPHAPVDSGKSHELDGLEASFTVPMFKKPIQELSLLELFNVSDCFSGLPSSFVDLLFVVSFFILIIAIVYSSPSNIYQRGNKIEQFHF